MAAMFIDGSGQNEQSLERTFHSCFLPSFTSFGWAVSEKKIKMWKFNRRQTPSDGKSSLCLWQGELILIIKECPGEILIKLAIVLKISKSSWNTAKVWKSCFKRNLDNPMSAWEKPIVYCSKIIKMYIKIYSFHYLICYYNYS